MDRLASHPWILRRIDEHDLYSFREALFLARTSNDPLVILHTLTRMRSVFALIERAAVEESRENGATWEQVAEALGRSRQSVHRQFADDDG